MALGEPAEGLAECDPSTIGIPAPEPMHERLQLDKLAWDRKVTPPAHIDAMHCGALATAIGARGCIAIHRDAYPDCAAGVLYVGNLKSWETHR